MKECMQTDGPYEAYYENGQLQVKELTKMVKDGPSETTTRMDS